MNTPVKTLSRKEEAQFRFYGVANLLELTAFLLSLMPTNIRHRFSLLL